MRLFDTSTYCDTDDVTNYLVEVLPPNKSVWMTFHVMKDFSLVLNSSSLRYRQASDDTDFVDLPDGIYEIKQSYKPNIRTIVHFYHLVTCDVRRKLRKQWDNLISDKCNISREDFQTNRDRLREIDEYLLAAEFKIDECLEKKEGKELYEFASKLLEQYTNECQC